MADRSNKAKELIRHMLTPSSVASMEADPPPSRFGGEFPRLALENVYEPLWTRPGLGLRDRSLVTIGILIGSGADRELRSHFAAGLRNGLTPEELEEIVYHATAYAGFPAASHALAIAAEVVAEHSANETETKL